MTDANGRGPSPSRRRPPARRVKSTTKGGARSRAAKASPGSTTRAAETSTRPGGGREGRSAGVRRVLGQLLRGFAAMVIGVTAAYFVYALVVTVADDALAAGERAAVAVALGLGFVVCLLMLALRLDDSLFDGGLAVRGLKGKLYVALMVCALLMVLVALLGGTARLGAIAVIIFPAAVAFGLLGTMSEMEPS